VELQQLVAALKPIGGAEAPETPLFSTVERVKAILDKYQEASHLLDPHLEGLVHPLILLARDAQLSPPVQAAVFEVLYNVCKVRGYKTVLKLFTHETADFHPVLGRSVATPSIQPMFWVCFNRLLLWPAFAQSFAKICFCLLHFLFYFRWDG
jgi:hypothetical protein